MKVDSVNRYSGDHLQPEADGQPRAGAGRGDGPPGHPDGRDVCGRRVSVDLAPPTSLRANRVWLQGGDADHALFPPAPALSPLTADPDHAPLSSYHHN